MCRSRPLVVINHDMFRHIFQSAKSSEANDRMSAGPSSDSWIARPEGRCFKETYSYCGVVEYMQSKFAATLVIAQKKNGKPLMWHEVWDLKKDQFGRVLILVNRLRSSMNGEVYSKDTPIDTVLQEGDLVMVEIKYSSLSPDNIYHYFANSAYKQSGSFSNMLSIRDPLRGVVDSLAIEAAVVRFGTFAGGVAKCVLTIHNLYYKGDRVKQNLPLGAVVSIGTQIYLEVTKFNLHEIRQEWEKLMYKDGVIFRATKAWLKDDPRPSKSDKLADKVFYKQEGVNSTRCKDSSASSQRKERNERNQGRSENEKSRESLTNLNVYHGIVEAITSRITAVICTAHRNGEPLTWKENWLASGVVVERALLLADHIRPSKTEPEYMKGTDINKILDVGDPIMIVVELSERKPDRCYKWFVRTSWKVGKEEKESCTVVANALPGNLHGVVDCLLTHSIGLIAFKTFHGMPAKAFFSHNNFYHNGNKIMDHLPLGSEVKIGTEVFLIAERWNPGTKPNATDQEMIKKQVHFRATLAWTRGSRRPIESGAPHFRKSKMPHSEGHQKHGFPDNPRSERSRGREDRRGRGRGRGPRSRGNRLRTGNRSGSGRDTGDGVSNHSDDSDSNFSDVSSMSDYFGAMKFEEAGFSSFRSEKHHTLDQEITNPSANALSGTIISTDEDWGLVQINDEEVHDFQPSHVLLYGLKLDRVPLNRLLRQGQVVNVYMKGGKVSMVEYGAPQLPNQMRKAVVTYCEKNSIQHDVRDILENIMLSYGV